MATVEQVLHAVRVEVERSTGLYGDWSDYSVDRMVHETMKEVRELLDAHNGNDVAGPHGMIPEGTQVAACLTKMLVQLARREAAGVRCGAVVVGG